MDHRSSHAFLFAVLIAYVALPQEPQFPADETLASWQTRLYNDSKSYLNDPLFELQKVMPELRGLKADEENLLALLTRIGQKTEDLSVQMPNLICREEVVQIASGSRSVNPINQEFTT